MTDRYLIIANFHVFVPNTDDVDGRRPEVRKGYSRGQVIEASDIPEDQDVNAWISEGLVTAADAA